MTFEEPQNQKDIKRLCLSGQQNCFVCVDLSCGDNINEEIKKLPFEVDDFTLVQGKPFYHVATPDVYVREGKVVVMGTPRDGHNCDENGCGQEHAIITANYKEK